MPFTLVKGTSHVAGCETDVDSIRFKAHRPANQDKLAGRPVELDAKRHAPLRSEVIATLKTHYKGHHQPLEFVGAAMHFLMSGLGITNVKFNPNGIKVASAADGTRGCILSRT